MTGRRPHSGVPKSETTGRPRKDTTTKTLSTFCHSLGLFHTNMIGSQPQIKNRRFVDISWISSVLSQSQNNCNLQFVIDWRVVVKVQVKNRCGCELTCFSSPLWWALCDILGGGHISSTIAGSAVVVTAIHFTYSLGQACLPILQWHWRPHVQLLGGGSCHNFY